MAVYSYGPSHRCRGGMNICHGSHHRAAADIPPVPEDETEETVSGTKKSIFDDIADEFFGGSIDSDKLLLALIIYTLIKEGADIKLILALGYILL